MTPALRRALPDPRSPRAVFPARRAPLAFLLLLLLLPATVPEGRAEEPGAVRLSPGAFLAFAGGAPLSRPPFPDVWDADPLRFPYSANESLFLALPGRAGASLPRADQQVRVLIQPLTQSLLVQARAGADVQWRRLAGGTPQRGPSLKGAARVERKGGRFTLAPTAGPAVPGGAAVSLRLASLDPSVPLEVNGKPYRGALEFHAEGAGFIAVNVLPVEEYLRGVVPLEMGRHDESRLEALKAQAVTARTYALKRILARTGDAFDVFASVQDQVYGGAGAEHAMSDRAIRATAGLVLLHGDSLAECYYHSTCGGITASRHEVWGGAPVPYLISAPDTDGQGLAWCRASRYMQWTQSWDAGALASIVRANLAAANARGPASFRRITGFAVHERFSDGRIRRMEILTDAGRIELRGDKTRWALKPSPGTGRILESARFEIDLRGDRVTAQGGGFGHGIGMCQMGALGRAAAGQDFARILDGYYPGTRLVKLSDR